MRKVAKAVVGAVGVVLVVAAGVLSDGEVTPDEARELGAELAVGVLAVYSVWKVRNATPVVPVESPGAVGDAPGT